MVRKLLGAAVLAALLSPPAIAQDVPKGTATLFAKGHFEGARRTITGATTNIPPFTARSVRLPAGEEWEFCIGNTFSGCRKVSASDPAIVLSIRSARPAGAAVAKAGTVLPPGIITSQSLRGFASEYFVAPERDGHRIAVQDDKQAAQEAETLCRASGWATSANHEVQPVNGATYLADVLCVQKRD